MGEERARSRSRKGGPLSVVIVEDDDVVRGWLAGCISQCESLRLKAEAASFREGLECLKAPMDLLLVDLDLGDGQGLELIRQCRNQWPAKIMVITVFGDEHSVLSAIEAGADGYLLKGAADRDIADALSTVMAGGAPISPSVARHLLNRLRSPGHGTPPVRSTDTAEPTFNLTARELEMLESLARGFSYKEVARYHGISYYTVAEHIQKIYKKLAVNSRSEAVYEAVQGGLIRLSE